MAALVQNIGSAQNKTSGTSIAISVSVTVTAGNDIFVSLHSDDAGTAHGVTDNLGNTYTQESTYNNSGVSKTVLFRGPVTTGGTLTTITCSWTTSVTAKVLLAQEYSGVGEKKVFGGSISSTNAGTPLQQTGNSIGEFWVYASTQETDDGMLTGNHNNGTIISRTGIVNATSGGGDASNISAAQGYAFSNTTTGSYSIYTFNATSTAKDGSGCGAIYYSKAVVSQDAFRFYVDDVSESGSTALAAQDTNITRDIGAGNQNVVLRLRLQTSSADHYANSESLDLRVSINGGSYSAVESGGDTFYPATTLRVGNFGTLGNSASTNGIGQSFKGKGGTLIASTMKLTKIGTPSDNIFLEVYAHTGTFGTSSLPTGSVLATSDTIAGSSLTGTATATRFTFSGGNQITLTENTSYCLVIKRVTPDGSNYYLVSGMSVTPNTSFSPNYNANWSADGNAFTYNGSSWTASTTVDYQFGVEESNPNRAVFGYNSSNLVIGGATTNRLGSGTGSFVAGAISDTNNANSFVLSLSSYTEVVYPITLKQSLLSVGDTLDFRVYKRGTSALDTYSVTPRITLTGNTTTTKTQTGKAAISAQTTKTQTGVARLHQTVTSTQTGISRIRVTVSRTQTGVARITASTTRTQTGVSRAQKTVTSTQTGISRLIKVTVQTQTGKGNIETAYTRANLGSLPTDTSALSTGYSTQDYTDVATSDNIRVGVSGTSGYVIHQFKATNNNNSTPISVSWEGQSTVAASTQTIYLQVYNWNSSTWSTVSSNNTAAANTDFILNGTISASVSNYYSPSFVVVFRVYQGV